MTKPRSELDDVLSGWIRALHEPLRQRRTTGAQNPLAQAREEPVPLHFLRTALESTAGGHGIPFGLVNRLPATLHQMSCV